MGSLPPHAATDFTPEQVKALYPSDLTLQYVQIFFRHGLSLIEQFPKHIANRVVAGERTPVRQRLVAAGIPPFWDVCAAADEFRQTALMPAGDFRSLHYRRKVEKPEPTGRLESVAQSGKRYWSVLHQNRHPHTSPEM